MSWKELIGEFLGTFILVFIGCGSVACSVLIEGFGGLYTVALIFGGGVSLAIYAVGSFSQAHLNPAVSAGFVVNGNLSLKKLGTYSLSQLAGAWLGGCFLYLLFNGLIEEFELAQGIVRGSEGSYHSAVMFGEFFPNPGFEKVLGVSWIKACFMEGLGTFVLMLSILLIISVKAMKKIAPLLIGLTVTILICFIAPYTQGGFNPARDFGPRMVACFWGWGEAAFPSFPWSFLTVYILSPVVGACLASVLFRFGFTRGIKK
jgi:glycerol uptake facilitator protein